ncbi:carboxypeptidase-like regulatory domain-containing protein [Hymenobacter wooponensis]|nr:carboxypeptidase-like regulatory domain-containing protein [Hymenobacter wooponensis]
MKQLLLIVFCLLLQPALGQQASVSGRVLDFTTGLGYQGATILQKGTSNGMSADALGNFTLGVPSGTDSVTLQVSAIGCVTQTSRVAAGSFSIFLLEADNREFCDLPVYPKLVLGLSSGVRYAPFGALLQHPRLFHRPYSAGVSYQTNLHRNYALSAHLELPALVSHNRLRITEAVAYNQLQAEPANARFRSYLVTFGVSIYRLGMVRMPTLLVKGGYAQYQPIHNAETSTASTGYGFGLGLSHSFFPNTIDLASELHATRWPGYWQWQGKLTKSVRFPTATFQTGLGLNLLRRYCEVSATVSYTFF